MIVAPSAVRFHAYNGRLSQSVPLARGLRRGVRQGVRFNKVGNPILLTIVQRGLLLPASYVSQLPLAGPPRDAGTVTTKEGTVVPWCCSDRLVRSPLLGRSG